MSFEYQRKFHRLSHSFYDRFPLPDACAARIVAQMAF
jgi:hypothetical protein